MSHWGCAELRFTGSEVVPPLRNTVRLIDYEPARTHSATAEILSTPYRGRERIGLRGCLAVVSDAGGRTG
jgi:hypothetical protein